MASKRNYKREYAKHQSSTKQIAQRSMRNKARNLLKPSPGMEVDHIIPLSKGGSNNRSNLRVVSRKTNRKKGSKRK